LSEKEKQKAKDRRRKNRHSLNATAFLRYLSRSITEERFENLIYHDNDCTSEHHG
jgi:hypothetical protein